MNKITKIIFSCAAVAAVTAALGTAAMAADDYKMEAITEGITIGADNTITVTANPQTGAETTFIVVPENTTEISNDTKISAIDQVTTATSLEVKTNLTVDADHEGTYELRVGGSEGTQPTVYKFKIYNAGGGTGETYLIGDVDDSGKIQSTDATAALRHASELEFLTGKALAAANADQSADGKVDSNDAQFILRYSADYRDSVGHVGETGTYNAN